MNLKSACQLAIVTMIISLSVALSAIILINLSLFSQNEDPDKLVKLFSYIMSSLLRDGGIVMFFMAFSGRLRDKSSNAPLFTVAGIFILTGTLIGGGTWLMNIVPGFQKLSHFRFVYDMALVFLYFVSGLCLSLFAFKSQSGNSSLRWLALVIGVASLIQMVSGVFNTIGTIIQFISLSGDLVLFGFIIMNLAFITMPLVIMLFMFAFSKSSREDMGYG